MRTLRLSHFSLWPSLPHFCRNYVNEMYPVVRTNIAHGNLCVLLLSEASLHQGKSGLPQCVWVTVGVFGEKCIFRCDGWYKKAVVVLWRSCVVVDVWGSLGTWLGGVSTTEVSLHHRCWHMFTFIFLWSSLPHSWQISLVQLYWKLKVNNIAIHICNKQI